MDMDKGATLKEKMMDQNSWTKEKHTSRGSKLINLFVSFVCASHMVACICISSRSFLSNALLVWCMLVVSLIDEIKN